MVGPGAQPLAGGVAGAARGPEGSVMGWLPMEPPPHRAIALAAILVKCSTQNGTTGSGSGVGSGSGAGSATGGGEAPSSTSQILLAFLSRQQLAPNFRSEE